MVLDLQGTNREPIVQVQVQAACSCVGEKTAMRITIRERDVPRTRKKLDIRLPKTGVRRNNNVEAAEVGCFRNLLVCVPAEKAGLPLQTIPPVWVEVEEDHAPGDSVLAVIGVEAGKPSTDYDRATRPRSCW